MQTNGELVPLENLPNGVQDTRNGNDGVPSQNDNKAAGSDSRTINQILDGTAVETEQQNDKVNRIRTVTSTVSLVSKTISQFLS